MGECQGKVTATNKDEVTRRGVKATRWLAKSTMTMRYVNMYKWKK